MAINQAKKYCPESTELAAVNQQLQAALAEQQRMWQLLIQKDLELSQTNDQLDRQVNQLQVLQSMMNRARAINNAEQVLAVIARDLVIELHFAAAVVLLGAPPFSVGVKYAYQEIDVEKLKRLSLLIPVYAGTPSYLADISHAPLEQKELADILQLTSCYALPIIIRQKCYGVFISGLNDPYQKLSEADLEFLELVATSIAITLESLETEGRMRYLDSLKSEFISIASHQLRTPLSAIKWSLSMMIKGDIGELNQEQKLFLEKTYKSNERMITLVNDLLDVSRIEEGRLEYKFVDINLKQMLQEILSQYQVFIAKKKLTVETNINQGLPVVIRGDAERLNLAFNNFIDNAIKFSLKHKSVRVEVESELDVARVIIADQGIGISPDDQAKLFTKFFRADSAMKMETQGTGLGLFIAKSIIEKHQGHIKIDSVVGQGTTVTCTFPVKKES